MSTLLSDYDYNLPEELIGQQPREPRDHARLMLVNRKNESIEHKKFYEIIDYLNEGDILVRNSTKVIPARLFGHKETGGVLEILLIKRIDLDTWECLLKPAKKLKIGQKLFIGHGNELIGELLEIKDDGNRIIKFTYEGAFEEVLDRLGKMPLPPYIGSIERKRQISDCLCYQGGICCSTNSWTSFYKRTFRKNRKKRDKDSRYIFRSRFGNIQTCTD